MIIKLTQIQKDLLFNVVLKDNKKLLEEVTKNCSLFIINLK